MRRRRGVTWAVVIACALALVPFAAAQEAETAAADLQENNVTFEEGALTDPDLAELDQVTADLQESDAAFKVVVLADEATDYPNADTFAAAVLEELGEDGRVFVYTPSTVGLTSNVDSAEEISSAKDSAIAAANQTNSYGAGVAAAAQELGVSQAEGGGSDDGGGGSGWILFLLLGLGAAALLFFLWRRSKRQVEQVDETQISGAEGKVRAEVDATANLILDLSDRADVPDADPVAKEHFREGARLFSESQELLEEADTRSELEAAFPKVVEARWRLECAQAVLDGAPEPPRPEPGPLFPPEPIPAPEIAAPEPVDRGPEPAYRGFDTSPWMTAAAMAAMAALANRGMSAPRARRRAPMDDSVFGDIFGGGFGGGGGGRGYGRPQTGSRRPRISLGPGRAGRGMGGRRR